MDHEHVRIEVIDATPPGVENVPARSLGEHEWELLRSPLYATGVASGDVIRVLDEGSGGFRVVRRGGNLCVQVFLGEAEADDADATARAAKIIQREIERIGGRIDGTTPGLISCTIDLRVGFSVIEETFAASMERCPGAQWQFANVYDPNSGEPLGWWE